SLGPGVAPSACEPGRDTSAILYPRLDHLARGRPLRLAMRWPRATGLASYLSGCLLLTGQRCSFDIADVSEGFHESCQDHMPFPVRTLLLSTFRWFSLGGLQFFESARVTRFVLIHGSNQIPSG